jgi:hypothetical protein
MTLKPKLYIMTYRSYMYAWIYYCTHQDLLIFFETKNWKFPSKFNFRLGFSDFDKIFLLWIQSIEIYLWYFLMIFILLIHWSHFWRIMFWTRKVNFWGETYLNTVFVKTAQGMWKCHKWRFCEYVGRQRRCCFCQKNIYCKYSVRMKRKPRSTVLIRNEIIRRKSNGL